MFYTFRQNNSGGSFRGPVLVCVECDSLNQADEALIERLPRSALTSCDCCGPRWSCAYDEDLLTEYPTYLGDPLTESGRDWVVYYREGNPVSGGKPRR
jgi:hypothetical protein